MQRFVRVAVAPLVLVSVVASGARAQSVAEVVEGMYAATERQAAGIQDYTLVHTVMGLETLSYFEKEMVDGHPVFRLKMSDGTGFSFSLGEEGAGLGDVFLYGPDLIANGRYAGTEQIGARSVHVLAVDDAAGLEIVPPGGPDALEFAPKSLRLYVDSAMMIPLRIVLVGDATADGVTTRDVTIQLDMRDVLPIEGLLVPYRTTVQVAGATVEITVAEVLVNAGPPGL